MVHLKKNPQIPQTNCLVLIIARKMSLNCWYHKGITIEQMKYDFLGRKSEKVLQGKSLQELDFIEEKTEA